MGNLYSHAGTEIWILYTARSVWRAVHRQGGSRKRQEGKMFGHKKSVAGGKRQGDKTAKIGVGTVRQTVRAVQWLQGGG